MRCAVLLAASLVAGCSAANGSDVPVTGPTQTPTVLPKTPTTLKPATGCAQSKVPLPVEAGSDGVELTVSTDPSRTSLLLKNTGSLTVVVVPDADFSSRLTAASYANPKDPASRAALIAVNNSGGAPVPGIPPYAPKTQVITLPPQWAICALTDDVRETASVRYVQDRVSSAQYFVTKAVADQLLLKVSPTRSRTTLIRCARGTSNTLKAHPELPDIELYVEILGPRSACRAGYKSLLHGDERAAGQLGATVLTQLGSAPRLLPNSALLSTTAGP
jgi:hypothetical protein